MNNLFIAPRIKTDTSGKSFSEAERILNIFGFDSEYLKVRTTFNEVTFDMRREYIGDRFTGFVETKERKIKSCFDPVRDCFLALNAEEQVLLNQIVSERFGATF